MFEFIKQDFKPYTTRPTLIDLNPYEHNQVQQHDSIPQPLSS